MRSTLYVSAQGYVSRLVVHDKRVLSRSRIVTRLPFGRHQQDTIGLGPDGRLYLGSGSTCDACRERDRRSGAILSFGLDGSDVQIVATGLRNPFGLVFDGDTLYASSTRATTWVPPSRPRPIVRDQAWRQLRLAGLLGELAAAEAPGLVRAA